MLKSIRAVYERERPFVEGDAELEAAFHRGLRALESIFRDCLSENLADQLRAGNWLGALRTAALLAREDPRRLPRELRALSGRGSEVLSDAQGST
jgi:hypothetical protein